MKERDRVKAYINIQDSRFSTAQNYIEEKLLKIWRSALEIDKINIEDNFYDLGGQSIALMKIVLDIEKQFAVKIDYKTFIEVNGNIAGLSEYISKKMDLLIQREKIKY